MSEGLYRILGLDPALPPWRPMRSRLGGRTCGRCRGDLTAIAAELVAESRNSLSLIINCPRQDVRVEVLTEPLCDAAVRSCACATARDITAQAQAVAALERSEASRGRVDARWLGSWERDSSTGQYFFRGDVSHFWPGAAGF